MTYFKHPNVYPNEAFVQQSVEKYFFDSGFVATKAKHIDLLCSKGDIVWQIEAKGHTKSIDVDFHTLLGQILRRMDDPNKQYGIALPDTPQLKVRATSIAPWVLSILKLHWIWISVDGTVTLQYPL